MERLASVLTSRTTSSTTRTTKTSRFSLASSSSASFLSAFLDDLSRVHITDWTDRGKRAVGVEYQQNPRVYPNATKDVVIARAKRLVVISAGTFGSPALLERSGIGAKKVLEKYGVPQLVDLPGVGENYQDHQVIFSPYLASEDADTIDGIVRNNEADYGSTYFTFGASAHAKFNVQNGLRSGFRMAKV